MPLTVFSFNVLTLGHEQCSPCQVLGTTPTGFGTIEDLVMQWSPSCVTTPSARLQWSHKRGGLLSGDIYTKMWDLVPGLWPSHSRENFLTEGSYNGRTTVLWLVSSLLLLLLLLLLLYPLFSLILSMTSFSSSSVSMQGGLVRETVPCCFVFTFILHVYTLLIEPHFQFVDSLFCVLADYRLVCSLPQEVISIIDDWLDERLLMWRELDAKTFMWWFVSNHNSFRITQTYMHFYMPIKQTILP